VNTPVRSGRCPRPVQRQHAHGSVVAHFPCGPGRWSSRKRVAADGDLAVISHCVATGNGIPDSFPILAAVPRDSASPVAQQGDHAVPADSSYFFSPTPWDGGGEQHPRTDYTARLLQLVHRSGDRRLPAGGALSTPGSRCGYTLPPQPVRTRVPGFLTCAAPELSPLPHTPRRALRPMPRPPASGTFSCRRLLFSQPASADARPAPAPWPSFRAVWPNNWRRSARVVSCFFSNSVT